MPAIYIALAVALELPSRGVGGGVPTGRVKGENRAPDLSGWRFCAETWPALVPKNGPRGLIHSFILKKT